MLILLYRCITWALTKCMEEKLNINYTRMMRAVLNKSWRQHFTKQQLYGHLLLITKTIKVRRTRHAGHCWRRKDELMSEVLLWTPSSHGRAKVGRPVCANTGCSLEDLPGVMNDRDGWRERVKEIRTSSATWWWWWSSSSWLVLMNWSRERSS